MPDKWFNLLSVDGQGHVNTTAPACRRLFQHIINNLKPRHKTSYLPTFVRSDNPEYDNLDGDSVKRHLRATMALFDGICTAKGLLSANPTIPANQVEQFTHSVFFLSTVLAALGPMLCGDRIETKREDKQSASGSASAGPSIENDPICWLGCRTESGRYVKCVHLLVTTLLRADEITAANCDAFGIDDDTFKGMDQTCRDAMSDVFQTPGIKGVSHKRWLKETTGIKSIAFDLSLSPEERYRFVKERFAALAEPK